MDLVNKAEGEADQILPQHRWAYESEEPDWLPASTPALEECDSCHEMRPVEGGESVLVHTHRIEGQAVGADYEWICADCVRESAGAEWDEAERRRDHALDDPYNYPI